MANMNWFEAFSGNWGQGLPQQMPMQQMPMQQMPAQQLPTQNATTQYRQPQVSPTRYYEQRNITNEVAPHVHPSHLKTINQHFIDHQHHFPHTQSAVNECYEKNTMCGTPFKPHTPGCGCSKRRGW